MLEVATRHIAVPFEAQQVPTPVLIEVDAVLGDASRTQKAPQPCD